MVIPQEAMVIVKKILTFLGFVGLFLIDVQQEAPIPNL
jgi:hypothetical protein